MVDPLQNTVRGCALLLLAAVLGCGGSEPLPPTGAVLDFVQVAGRRPLRTERTLEFSAAEDDRRALRSGWSGPETAADGRTFTWAVGRKATVALTVLGPGPRRLHLRCRPFTWPGAEPQTVRVRVNGTALGDVTLQPGFHDYRMEVPEDALRFGDNGVELTFAYAARPSEREPGNGDRRLLSVACDALALKASPTLSTPGPERDGATSRREVRVQVDGATLAQPPRTELAFPVTVPEAGALTFGKQDGPARIVIRRAGEPDLELFRGADAVDDARVDLAAHAGQRVDLVFQALGESGTTAAAPVRWTRPQLLGAAPPLDLTTRVALIVVVPP